MNSTTTTILADNPPTFDNLVPMENGYFITNEDIVNLVNYIENITEENQSLHSQIETYKEKVSVYEIQLEEERTLADRVIDSQQETITGQENLIKEQEELLELQEEQLAEYESIKTEYESIVEKQESHIQHLESESISNQIRAGFIGAGITSVAVLVLMLL